MVIFAGKSTTLKSKFSGSGELEFEEFITLASRFMAEEDAEAMQSELKEAFRLYDKEGQFWLFMIFSLI